jgi:DNA-binding transcriptional LysR family regulator
MKASVVGVELRVLRYFLAAAREQTIIGAAESLHISQPTLSRQLMDLERQLGKKLFERGSRRITLTEDGMFLRRRAQEIVDLADKTEADFSGRGEQLNGDVRIGAGETEGMRMIAKTVESLRRSCPDIRWHLYSGNAQDLAESLDKGLLDFGVLVEPADVSKYDYLKLPMTDVWGLLMRKDNPLAAKSRIRPQDLYGEPLLCSRQMLEGNGLSGWLGTGADKLDIVATYNLIFNAALMVEEGVGSALTLDKLVAVKGRRELCFRPLEPKLEVALDLVWKKYQVFSRAAAKFLETLQKDIELKEKAV